MLFVRDAILEGIFTERGKQDAKWGEQNHANAFWTAILGEEFGEACQEVCKMSALAGYASLGESRLKQELLQIAAVAVAWLECIERRKGPA